MKNFAMALSLFTSLISTTFANVVFSDTEAPFVTLEKAYKTAKTFSADVIKPVGAKPEVQVVMLDILVKPTTTLQSVGDGNLLYLRLETTTTRATPARGPLFPAQPARTSLTGKTLLCLSFDCGSGIGSSYKGTFSTDTDGQTVFKFAGSNVGYTFKIVNNVIIAKSSEGYIYGWIE